MTCLHLIKKKRYCINKTVVFLVLTSNLDLWTKVVEVSFLFINVYFVIFATTLFLIGTTFGGMLEQVDGFNCDLTVAVGLSLASVYITIQLNVYFLCHLLYSEASCL